MKVFISSFSFTARTREHKDFSVCISTVGKCCTKCKAALSNNSCPLCVVCILGGVTLNHYNSLTNSRVCWHTLLHIVQSNMCTHSGYLHLNCSSFLCTANLSHYCYSCFYHIILDLLYYHWIATSTRNPDANFRLNTSISVYFCETPAGVCPSLFACGFTRNYSLFHVNSKTDVWESTEKMYQMFPVNDERH